jgi:hypothetical protein
MRGSDDFFHSRIDQMIDLRAPACGTRLACTGVLRQTVTIFIVHLLLFPWKGRSGSENLNGLDKCNTGFLAEA